MSSATRDEQAIHRNSFSSRVSATVAAATALVLFGGCTTVETQSFRTPPDRAVESAQVAVDADFSRYDALLPEEMGIFFPNHVTMDDAEIARLRQIFRQAFIDELEGYNIVGEPGPSTMQVQASLIDLRNAAGSDMMALRDRVRQIAEPGSLVFLMELKDSVSGRVLGRAADSARTPNFETDDGAETNWAAVNEAARYWARLFRQFLDENTRG